MSLGVENMDLGNYDERLIIGRFVRLMLQRLAEADEASRPVLEEALQIGIAYLSGRGAGA